MSDNRIHNFNAGPSALPLPVLEEIQSDFLNFRNTGMSVTEISHRSAAFDAVMNEAVERTKRLLKIDDSYHVLFLQGGASLQFAMIPMNFLADGRTADYVNTGTWSTKAVKEAEILKKNITVPASSEDKNFSYIPRDIPFSKEAAYVHITSNNTIKGTQFSTFPDTGGAPIVSDMSSDIMSRPLDMDKFGLIYAGAQKNLGPSGTCMVIVKDDFMKTGDETLPSMLKYGTYAAKNSMYNTPPCFGVYTVSLVLKWIEEQMGGLEEMDAYNTKKADLLYDFIDSGSYYKGTAEKESRSKMNVTFRLPSEDLEKKFVQQALDSNLGGLKGHRSVGGCRASIYNAVSMEAVETLVKFMESFEKENRV